MDDLVFHYDPTPASDNILVDMFKEGVTSGYIYVHDGERVYAHTPASVVVSGDDAMIVPMPTPS